MTSVLNTIFDLSIASIQSNVLSHSLSLLSAYTIYIIINYEYYENTISKLSKISCDFIFEIQNQPCLGIDPKKFQEHPTNPTMIPTDKV